MGSVESFRVLLVMTVFNYVIPDENIKLYYVEECEPAVEKAILLKTFLAYIGEDERGLNAEFHIPYDIDRHAKVKLIIRKWSDGKWTKDHLIVEERLFYLLERYIPRIWGEFRREILPEIKNPFHIEAGTYKIYNFQTTEELELFDVNGKFKVDVYLLRNNEAVACRSVEIRFF